MRQDWEVKVRTCLRRRVDSEAELGLLSVVHRKALQQERTQARASASTHCIEDQESLQTYTARPAISMHVPSLNT